MRFLTVASLFVLSIFGAQLVRIQGFDAQAVAEEAQLKREAAQIIPAMRGQILAADGTVLASSVVREVVVADQTAVCTYGTKENECDPATSADAVQRAATELAPLLDTTVSELVPELTGTSRYRILSRDVTPLTWNTISELGIPGIYRDRRETRSERTYPQGTTTAALVGYVTNDGEAGGGVEKMMEDAARGHARAADLRAGPRRHGHPGGREHARCRPSTARTSRLTINSSLQWYAQNVARPADQGDQGRVRHRRHHEREDRRPAQRRVLPDVRPQHRRRQEGRQARQRRLLGRVRAGIDLEGHDDRRGRSRRRRSRRRRRSSSPTACRATTPTSRTATSTRRSTARSRARWPSRATSAPSSSARR